MDVLVCVKRVPGTGSTVPITDDGLNVDTRHLGFTIGPHEECAVEEAIRLTDAHGGEVTVLTVADGEAVDFLTEVRGHGDHYAGPPAEGDAAALVGLPGGTALSQSELVGSARSRAAELGLADGARPLFAAERIRPLDWLLVPLAVKGSVVISRNTTADVEQRAAAERASVIP